MENDSFKAQVSAVFDMNGQIHPRQCRFKNGLGEIITVESLTDERENSVDDRIQRAFLCSTYMYNRKRYFVYVTIYHFIHGLQNKEFLSKNIIIYYHMIEVNLDKHAVYT